MAVRGDGVPVWGHRPVKRVLGTGRSEAMEQESDKDQRMHEGLVAGEEELHYLLFGGLL